MYFYRNLNNNDDKITFALVSELSPPCYSKKAASPFAFLKTLCLSFMKKFLVRRPRGRGRGRSEGRGRERGWNEGAHPVTSGDTLLPALGEGAALCSPRPPAAESRQVGAGSFPCRRSGRTPGCLSVGHGLPTSNSWLHHHPENDAERLPTAWTKEGSPRPRVQVCDVPGLPGSCWCSGE